MYTVYLPHSKFGIPWNNLLVSYAYSRGSQPLFHPHARPPVTNPEEEGVELEPLPRPPTGILFCVNKKEAVGRSESHGDRWSVSILGRDPLSRILFRFGGEFFLLQIFAFFVVNCTPLFYALHANNFVFAASPRTTYNRPTEQQVVRRAAVERCWFIVFSRLRLVRTNIHFKMVIPRHRI